MEYIVIIFLVILSGLFSGMTLGLLSLDLTDLERKVSLGDKQAKKVYKIRKRGNLLLCTLLLGNVAVNAVLAIFLKSLMGGIIAVLVATGLIVIFGEILPQAAFSRYALKVGSKISWLVRFFIIILYPVAAPIAWVLDKMLGKELPTVWSREELKEIIKFHEDSPDSSIDQDEERIITGALSFSETRVEEIVTPRKKIYALEFDEPLDSKKLVEIKKRGVSRIPVYKEKLDKIVGILYVKDLITANKSNKVGEVYRRDHLIIISPREKLDSLLNKFIKARVHLAFVYKNKVLQGIVSLEDVIEEVLRVEIVDEAETVKK